MKHRYLVASVLLFIVIMLQSFYGFWFLDFWEHCAVVRELSTHPSSPAHPLLLVNAAHPFYSPYLLSVALFVRLGSITPIVALTVAGLLNLVLLLVGLRLFLGCFFKKDLDKVSSYALLLLLFLWPAQALNWSGFIHFKALGFVLPYPSTFAIGITFLLLALFYQALGAMSSIKYILALLLTSIVILTHPPIGVFAITGITAISLHYYTTRGVKPVIAGAMLVACSVGLAFLWPWYSFFDMIVQGNTEFHARNYVLYRKGYLIWPSLVLLPFALPLLISRLKQNKFDALILMLCASIAVYFAGYITENYVVGRIISFIAILIQIVLAARLAQLEAEEKTRVSRWIIPGVLLFTGAVAFNFSNINVVKIAWHGAMGSSYSYGDYEEQGNHVRQYDVVMSDIKTSWWIPAFSGRVVASRHPLYWVDDHAERRKAIERFFSKSIKPIEKKAIIAQYKVNYILINKSVIKDPQAYYIFGSRVLENNKFILIGVSPGHNS